MKLHCKDEKIYLIRCTEDELEAKKNHQLNKPISDQDRAKQRNLNDYIQLVYNKACSSLLAGNSIPLGNGEIGWKWGECDLTIVDNHKDMIKKAVEKSCEGEEYSPYTIWFETIRQTFKPRNGSLELPFWFKQFQTFLESESRKLDKSNESDIESFLRHLKGLFTKVPFQFEPWERGAGLGQEGRNAGAGIFGRGPMEKQGIPRQPNQRQGNEEEHKEGDEQLQPHHGIVEITMTQTEIGYAASLYFYLKNTANYVARVLAPGMEFSTNVASYETVSRQFSNIAKPEEILRAAQEDLELRINPWDSVRKKIFKSLCDDRNQLPSWVDKLERLIDLTTAEAAPSELILPIGRGAIPYLKVAIQKLLDTTEFKRLSAFLENGMEDSFEIQSVKLKVVPDQLLVEQQRSERPERPPQRISPSLPQMPGYFPFPLQPQERVPGSSHTLLGANVGPPPRPPHPAQPLQERGPRTLPLEEGNDQNPFSQPAWPPATNLDQRNVPPRQEE